MTRALSGTHEVGGLGVRLWLPVGCFALLSVLLFHLAGFRDGHEFALLSQLVLGILVTHYLGSRTHTAKLGQILGGFLAVTLFMSASLLLTHAAATPARPLVDAQLLAADRWMGYDWREFIGFFAQRPALALSCVLAYNTHFLQPYLLAAVLVLTGHFARFEKMVLVFLLAMVATIIIFVIWPVGSPWGHEGLNAAQLAPYRFPQPRTIGWEADFLRIRAGYRAIPESFQAGLVSFPSFHCISAIVFLWAAWPVKWLRFLLLPTNVMMITAALFVGCHYLVDVVAGAVIALLAIAVISAAYARLLGTATPARGRAIAMQATAQRHGPVNRAA